MPNMMGKNHTISKRKPKASKANYIQLLTLALILGIMIGSTVFGSYIDYLPLLLVIGVICKALATSEL